MELLKHFRHTDGIIEVVSEEPYVDCIALDTSHIEDFYTKLHSGLLTIENGIVTEIQNQNP
jgi:hypothetical protein